MKLGLGVNIHSGSPGGFVVGQILGGPVSADQDFLVPDDAVVGDYAGQVKAYPQFEQVGVTPSYAIVGVSTEYAVSSSGLITIIGALSVGTDTLTVRISKFGYDFVDITASIEVIDSTSDCFFVDLDSVSDGAGTRADPRNTVTGIVESINETFLFKRGSSQTLTGSAILQVDGLTYAAYGIGAKPTMKRDSGSPAYCLYIQGSADGTVIRDINFTWDTVDQYPNVFIVATSSAVNTVIKHCDFERCYTPIAHFSAGDGAMTIEWNYIHDVREDGMILTSAPGNTINANTILRPNLNWDLVAHTETGAAGDGIQLTTCTGIHYIKNNYIDRSNSGNKFCIIVGGDDRTGSHFYIQDNFMICPIRDGDSNGSVGVYTANASTYLDRNYLYNGKSATSVEGSNQTWMYARYNIFEDFDGTGAQACHHADKGWYINNVFKNVAHGINEGFNDVVYVYNNIFSVRAGDIPYTRTGYDCDYNLFTAEVAGMFGGANDSLSDWQGASTNDDNSLTGPAGLIDVDARDFRLATGSNAIDAGTGAFGLTGDFYGNSVTGTVDIGVHEKN